MENKKSVWQIFMIICAIYIVIVWLFPFLQSDGILKEALQNYSNEPAGYGSSIKNGDIVNLTLFQLTEITWKESTLLFAKWDSLILFGILITLAVMNVFLALFELINKPIPVIVFALLSIAVTFLLGKWLTMTGRIDDNLYHFTPAYLGSVGIHVVAIASAVKEIQRKREQKRLQTLMEE